jgi:hypothetical protein
MTEQPPGPPPGNYPPPPPGNYPPPPPGGYPPPPPQGGGYPPPGYGTQPDNYLVWAILVTVFCCLPLGIVSIVKSTQVSGLWAQGRYAEAYRASDDAKKWAMWSAIIGGIGILIGIIVNVAVLSAPPS